MLNLEYAQYNVVFIFLKCINCNFFFRKHNAYLGFFLELIQNELNDLNNKYKSLDITTNVNG